VVKRQGQHRFEYALAVRDAEWESSRIPPDGVGIQLPTFGRGRLPAQHGIFLKTSSNVIVEAMPSRGGGPSKSDLSSAVGVSGQAEINVNLPHLSAALTDLSGHHAVKLEGGPAYRFPIRPQQIVTLRLAHGQPVAEIEPLIEWDALVPEHKRSACGNTYPTRRAIRLGGSESDSSVVMAIGLVEFRIIVNTPTKNSVAARGPDSDVLSRGNCCQPGALV